MKLLTPTGYKDIADVNIGDELIAYDVNTGDIIINNLLSKEIVTPDTYAKTDKWLDSVLINNEFKIENITTLLINGVEDKASSIFIGNTITYEGQDILVESIENIPAGESHTQDVLTAYVINNTWTLCKYQSIWVNNNIVKHAPQLQIGDIIFDGSDKDIEITSIEEVIINDWWRLEVSGDHSYIEDNLTLHNASRFWVGGTGNWDASTTTNWSSTSGGGGGSSVPTSADDVTFDNLSNATLYTCTVTADGNCSNLTLNAPASGALSFAGSSARTLNIYGNYSMAATNVTISYLGAFNMRATSGTKTITSNGNNFVSACLQFNGVGGTFQFADNLAWSGGVPTSIGQLYHLNGTIDPNGKTVSLTGASAILTGNFTFYDLTRTGTAAKGNYLAIQNGNLTITNTFTCNGNSATNRMWVYSYNSSTASIGVQRTITSAINSITNSDFQDINGAGAASWNLAAITGLSGDCGGNSGITFTTAATQTATGTASFSWDNAAIWTSRVPLPQDDVVVNNAFVAGRTVTMNMPRAGKTITFGCTGSPTASIATSTTIYGGLDLSGVGALSGTSYIDFMGRSSYNINSNNLTHAGIIYFEAVGGTYTLTNHLTTTSTFYLYNGTFDAATYNVTAAIFNSSRAVARTLTVGTGTWNITGSGGTVWSCLNITNFTVNRNTPINFTYSGSSGARTIVHGSSGVNANRIDISITAGSDIISWATANRFNNVDFTGFSGSLSLTSNNTTIFGDLKFSTGMTISAGTNPLLLEGSGTQNLTSNGRTIEIPITINATGTVKLADALTMGSSTGRTLTLTAGTLDLNGNNLTHFGTFVTSGSTSRTLALGSNTYENTTTTASTIWSAAGSNFSVTGTGTIKVSGSTANIRTFAGGGFTYPTLWFTNATANGELDITGSNTFAVLKCTDTNGQSIKFTAGTTQTISTASGFQLTGAAGNLITLDTITGASTFTLSCAGNNIVGSYLSISRCLARGGARWFAQNSTNNTGNNGWRFAQASNRQMSGIGAPTLMV